MEITDVVHTENYTKQSCLHTTCSLGNKSKEYKYALIPVNISTKPDEVIQKKKYSFNESDSIKQARLRSVSHWPHSTPSNKSMASSGWFSCNILDRVICIYCNTICHEWSINDDPAEVHTRLAPLCPLVISMPPVSRSPKIINENINKKFQPTHPAMAEISRREATFSAAPWSANSPSIEDLVRAGFFCAGVANTVTCFYCNGSLHKWGSNDNPTIEHARWFPHCLYAKHLCGNSLYEQIRKSKKRVLSENKIPAEELSRLVTARLDLPVVRRLRLKYPMTIIKRVLEDQLRIKNDDFPSDTDFTIACLILQKQIDTIKGCKDKLIIPSKNDQLEISKESCKPSFGECLICLSEEKQLACMPCGHLCACVPCGYALRSCPVCREKIQSFIKINS